MRLLSTLISNTQSYFREIYCEFHLIMLRTLLKLYFKVYSAFFVLFKSSYKNGIHTVLVSELNVKPALNWAHVSVDLDPLLIFKNK